MDAYLAQRGQPIRGPIHFGPNSACGRPGLAQYQLFLPLQQASPCSRACCTGMAAHAACLHAVQQHCTASWMSGGASGQLEDWKLGAASHIQI